MHKRKTGKDSRFFPHLKYVVVLQTLIFFYFFLVLYMVYDPLVIKTWVKYKKAPQITTCSPDGPPNYQCL